MSKPRSATSSARERVVKAAERLFYAEGIRSVGVDRIIAEAGVAKMTLYNHFASKDALILAVLKYREELFDSQFEEWMGQHIEAGMDRFEAFFAALKIWFETPDFRGCMFINACAELANAEHEGSQFSTRHKKRFHAMLKEVISETAGVVVAETQTQAIALLVEGAIVTAMMEQTSKPADVAREASQTLLSASSKGRM